MPSSPVPAAQIAPALHRSASRRHDRRYVQCSVPDRRATRLTPEVRGTSASRPAKSTGCRSSTARIACSRSAGRDIGNASVLVGTTQTYFSAEARPHESAIALRAPRADLSDFKTSFDTGDTLDGDGTGRSSRPASHVMREYRPRAGKIDVRGFRHPESTDRRYQSGLVERAQRVTGALPSAAAKGCSALRARSALTPPAARTIDADAFAIRSRREVENLDLSRWMPALGMQTVPITGRASGSATVHGRYPEHATSKANASVADGDARPAHARSRRTSAFIPPVAASSSIAPRSRPRRSRHRRRDARTESL